MLNGAAVFFILELNHLPCGEEKCDFHDDFQQCDQSCLMVQRYFTLELDHLPRVERRGSAEPVETRGNRFRTKYREELLPWRNYSSKLLPSLFLWTAAARKRPKLGGVLQRRGKN